MASGICRSWGPSGSVPCVFALNQFCLDTDPTAIVNDSPILRTTPYEVAFAATPYETEVFATIAADAELHGTDPLLLEPFSLLPSAGEAVRAFVPPDAPPEAFEQYRALLYHGFNYWRFDRSTLLVLPAVARYLVEAQPRMEQWEVALPHPSLYLQLPPNLFWGSVSPDSTPEAVDGMFVTGATVRGASSLPFLRLEVLLVLGLRRDRAGFSIIPFDTEAGPGIAAAWGEAGSREKGSDFENILPGGELAGLYSLLTVGEVLKLLGRILWYIDTYPGDLSALIVPGPSPPASSGAMPPSRIPHRVINLGTSEEGGAA